MKGDMTRARWLAVGLWAGCLVSVLAALGFGVATAHDVINRPFGMALVVGFGLAAEALFWAGGAVMGLSFFVRRGGWLSRLLARRSSQADLP